MNTKSFFFIALIATMGVNGAAAAHAKLATVGAVHDYVNKVWGIEIPHGGAASNLLNMRYLMQLVDAANLELNGWTTSDFATDEDYATSKIADAMVGKDAADTLIEKVEWHFFFTPATTLNAYSFSISAAGRFYIDWGDGIKQAIRKKTTTAQTISHTYTDGGANTHEIALGGHATKYTEKDVGAITFDVAPAQVSTIRGCLGCVFSTIDDESIAANQRQPRFFNTFFNNTELSGEIPENLFDGVHGAPVTYMFSELFTRCSKLKGTIPENLFSGISGAPAPHMYHSTFYGCSGLTGPIPDRLFGTFDGPMANDMFRATFEGCSKLSGDMPQNLFEGMIPSDSYLYYMFYRTFYGIPLLTGYSPKIGDKYLYELWPNSGQLTYGYDTKLSDYACIPTSWGGAGTKTPGTCEPAPEEGDTVGDTTKMAAD